MDVSWAPGVLMVAPGVSAGLDGDETISPLVVGQAAAGAGEIRVERRGVVIRRVNISPGGVGLPHLDQRGADWVPIAVDDAAANHDPLAERLSIVLPRQVSVLWEHGHASKHRAGQLVEPFRR